MPIPLLWKKLLSFGRRSEILAVDYLRSLGYRVVASSFRTPRGEIDVIAWDAETLVFIEVKARKSTDPPEDAVNLRKQKRIILAAQTYISRHRLHDSPYRFDILAITSPDGRDAQFRLLRDAFRAS
jgi:putative endonuclease